jgi:GNAT superfamily N-acetyltransferase
MGNVARVSVDRVDVDQAPTVFALVTQLLLELGEEGEEAGSLDETALSAGWRARPDQHVAFLARSEGESAIGVVTVAEAFAVYAGGAYGIINEMYVVPGFRSAGVGALLVDAVKTLGRARGWRRVDVTAPESARWSRTRLFYERMGFTFTGPKLKVVLSSR